jgi:putrescine aminotransferase
MDAGFPADEGHPGDFLNNDRELYEKYASLINSAYPNFLRKMGIGAIAAKAEGATITDSEGRTYLDCVAGYGIHNLGHNHPALTEALMEQIAEGGLYGRPFISRIQVQFAEFLSKILRGSPKCSFVCNSGSEAVDSAIKLARLVQNKSKIITMENSFHGFTYGALSASGIHRFKRKLGPFLPDIIQVPYGDLAALEEITDEHCAAVMMEPIQHEAGMFLPPPGYLKEVRHLCQRKGLLLIMDEVKTGCGKTGELFAYYHYDVEPDILVLGKSLGGGIFPIGALVINENLLNKFSMNFSMSASSYAGNTLASRVALETLKILSTSDMVPECARKGRALMEALNRLSASHPKVIKKVAGLGLMIGIRMDSPQTCLRISQEIIKRHVLAFPSYGSPASLVIEPPLVISGEQLDRLVEELDQACATVNH